MSVFRVIIFVLVFLVNLDATDWVEIRKISLKKDELTSILIKMNNNEKLLEFRWTLYKNELLTTHRFYDSFPFQTIMSKKHPNDAILIHLANTSTRYVQAPMLLIKFVDFDFKTKSAKFRIMLYDKNEEMILDFLKGD